MPSLSKAHLAKRLGLPRPEMARWHVVSDRVDAGVRIRELRIGSTALPCLCLSPTDADKARSGAGILYCHAHGNAYGIGKQEVINGRPSLLDPPLGLTLARAGATVICPDLPGFGERRSEGTESALAKAALWQGQCLLGQMAADLMLALDVLQALCEPAHVATVGISMGGTLAYLVAALRRDITACAQLCVYSDLAPLIRSGAHDLHGIYMTIPGLLPDHDMSDIAALVAPRPHFVLTGALDALTPDAGYHPAQDRLCAAYDVCPDALSLLREPMAGHHETQRSRTALLAFLSRHLSLDPATGPA